MIPLLLECDREGRILWTSRWARLILHNPKRLLDILTVRKQRQRVLGIDLSTFRFWILYEFRDSVLIAAVGTSKIPATQDLSPLHRKLTENLFRLLVVERRLYERARRRRGGGGKAAVQQIDMERRRLGRELHTGVGQMLAAVRWQLEVISDELPDASVNVRQVLDNISTLTAQALEQVRGVSRRLHPPEWQRLTLESALRQLWEISGIPQRLDASLEIDALPGEPELEVKVLLYRAFQEALSNVVRHSQARRIEASLRISGAELTLAIADDGVGFDIGKLLASPASLASGIGLRSIREAAEGLGGKFGVESGPAGTKLVITAAMDPAGR